MFNILNRYIGHQKALNLFNGTARWTDPDVVRAVNHFVTLAANNGPPDSNVLNQNQVVAKYLNGRLAGMYLDNNGGNVNIDRDVMDDLIALPLPIIPGGVETVPSTQQDVTNLAYASAREYANATKKPLIDQLIIALTSREAAREYLERANVIVPHLNIDYNPAMILPLNRQSMQVAQAQPGRKWLISFTPAEFRTIFRDACNEIWYGNMNAVQFTNLMQSSLYGRM
jgi:ABC-type glycerol-3-phosphate transport system substrate-binding protein